jgi:peptide/nickel transport system substrate-binding protein
MTMSAQAARVDRARRPEPIRALPVLAGFVVIIAGLLGPVAAAAAKDLRIGLSAEPSALDPHFHNLTPNNGLLSHVF